jgi:hypothetical protein
MALPTSAGGIGHWALPALRRDDFPAPHSSFT